MEELTKQNIEKYVYLTTDIQERLLKLSKELSVIDNNLYTEFESIETFKFESPERNKNISSYELKVAGNAYDAYETEEYIDVNVFYASWLWEGIDTVKSIVQKQKEERERIRNERLNQNLESIKESNKHEEYQEYLRLKEKFEKGFKHE